MIRRVTIALLVAAGAFAGFAADAAPRVSADSTAWQLDVEFHDPQRIRLRRPGDAEETTYWYLLFKVTNNTGADRQFFPSFRLVTSSLQVVEGGTEISPSVYDVIAARHQRELPFLAPPSKVTGALLQGEANARSSVAIFRDFDREASSFTLFCSGFSGEVERLPNPAYDADKSDSKENPREFLLRKTLAVTYDLPGDAETRDLVRPIRRTREWVMR